MIFQVPMEKTRQSNDSLIEILEMHPFEVELLRNLRTRFRFGEVVIIMKDGLPLRLKRVTEFAELDK